MIQLFLSICRGAQVWMLIIELDVAVKFQGKQWDLNSPSDSTACAWNSNPVLFKMMHSSIWEALFVSVSGKSWPTKHSWCKTVLFLPCRSKLDIFSAGMEMYLSNREVCEYFRLKNSINCSISLYNLLVFCKISKASSKGHPPPGSDTVLMAQTINNRTRNSILLMFLERAD